MVPIVQMPCRLALLLFTCILMVDRAISASNSCVWMNNGEAKEIPFQCQLGDALWIGVNGDAKYLRRNGAAATDEIYSLRENYLIVKNMTEEWIGTVQCSNGNFVEICFSRDMTAAGRKDKLGWMLVTMCMFLGYLGSQ